MEMMSQNGESSGSWAHAFNPNTQKVEVGGLPGGLHSKFQDGQGNIGKLYVKNLRREKKEEEEEEKEEEGVYTCMSWCPCVRVCVCMCVNEGQK